jgi:GntR family transcriptional regulator/MocR family aminotransferase
MKLSIAARYLTDRHPPAMTEGIVTAFIEQGHFAAHLRRMCAQYQKARDHVVAGLRARAGDLLEIDVPDQGMHLTARLPAWVSDIAVAAEGLAGGVLLGFTGFDRAQLDTGMERLAAVLRAHCSRPRSHAMESS